MAPTPERLRVALADRYRLERELGEGGMATVYLAHDLKHDRAVAVKVLRADLTESLGRVRFLREIQLAARLNHPHILPLHDSGEADGFLFFVMPVMRGQTLRDKLEDEGQLSVEAAVRITTEVADALDYAHRHDVVHRDIKPENILLHEGHAVVADFGIGKAIVAAADETGTVTRIGVTVGTPTYMSPEQAAGDVVDGRSDLFALGCVLYEMLTGQVAFGGATMQAILGARFVHTPTEVRVVRAEVPEALSRTVDKMLAKSADERHATGAEIRFALVEGMRSGAEHAVVAAAPGAAPAEAPSIAVLPFANMSASPDEEYFADGITEEIINTLAQVPGLKVAARTSCFAFKGKNEDLRVVGEKLGVRTVLEGSVRKAGPKLRVTAQLINVADGFHLWSEKYDRELIDVLALQDELAAAIAGKLRISLRTGEAPRARPRNLEAYELLLKGRVLLAKRGRAIIDARACFEQAIVLDPELAEAHALLGDAYRVIGVYGMSAPGEILPRARDAAERALALDPHQVEALATLASIAAIFERDLKKSDALTRRALARDPYHVRALCEHALTLTVRSADAQDREQARRQLEVALEADPLNPWAMAMNAFSLTIMGRTELAATEAQRAIDHDPGAFTGYWALVWALGAAGRDDEALAVCEPALLMSGRNSRVLNEVAAIQSRRGDMASAEAVYVELTSRAKTGYIGFMEQGAAAASAGRMDEALALVARGIEARESPVIFTLAPGWGPFRADPRGQKMLEDLVL